jgi:PPOX class probable F420-dependent enzyme
MSVPMPADLRRVVDDPTIAHLTTLDPDGWPQASAVWVARDGDRIVVNTAEGRRKWRNMRHDDRVALSISPVDEPYVNWSIQGRVTELRTSDGWEVIDAMARQYWGREYPRRPGMVRVTVVVDPTRIVKHG